MKIDIYQVKIGSDYMDGLAYIRKTFGLTMKDLAEQMGVSSNTINLWEKGKLNITDIRLKQLEDFFQLPISFFYKKEFNEDELIIIETSRTKYIMTRLQNSKYSDNYIANYVEIGMKPDDLEYFLDNLTDSFKKLEAREFIHMVDILDSVVEYCLYDIKNIARLDMAVACVEENSEAPNVLEANKEDLIKNHIRYLIKQWSQVHFNELEDEEYGEDE